MAAAKSPITALVEAIADSSLIKGVGVAVYFGVAEMARTDADRRIVIYCAEGAYVFPELATRRNSAPPPLADVDQHMIAKVWAENHDEAWDIQRRFFQALYQNTKAGGPLYKHGSPEWPTIADTSEQGEALTIRFRLQLPLERIAETTATITTVIETTAIENPATGDTTAGPTITIT